MPDGALGLAPHLWMFYGGEAKIRLIIDGEGSDKAEEQHKTCIPSELIIPEDFAEPAFKSIIAEHEVHSGQEHENDKDILDQRLIVPKGGTVVLG